MKQYNEAVQLLQQQRYLEAEQILRALFNQGQHADEVKWSLGLTQIFLGYPHRALQYWRKINDKSRFQVAEKMEQVEQVLPTYQVLYNRYNEALVHVEKKEYEQAFVIFQQLLEHPDALPLEFYEGFMNTGLYLNKHDEVASKLQQAPKHVISAPTIRRAQLVEESNVQMQKMKGTLADNHQKMQVLEQQVKNSQQQRKGLLAGVGALAVALVATIVVLIPGEEPTSSVVQQGNQAVENKPIVEQVQEDARVKELEGQVEKLEQELVVAQSTIDATTEKESLLAVANLSMDSLIGEAQYKQYKVGYQYYQNGQYEQAVKALQQSRQYEQSVYYADDALYYTIQSKRQLGDDSIAADYEQFLSQQGEYFIKSPYYDDVLLQYANYHLTQQNEAEAVLLLQQIKTEFAKEWTAAEADRLLSGLGDY